MLTRMIAAGLLAGVLAGVIVSGLQHATTVPIIIQAEAYERGDAKPAGHQHSSVEQLQGSQQSGEVKLVLVHGDAAPVAGAAGQWAPADGFERTAYTTVATIGTAVGFALMLLAAMLASGVEATPRNAVLWGLGAFIATGLAPAVGLPPELPGFASADLIERQTWWIATAAASATGIWLMFRQSGPARLTAGIALILAPHLFGAPHPAAFSSTAPAELAGHFAAASLAVHAVLWTLTGALAGYFWQWLGRSQSMASAQTS